MANLGRVDITSSWEVSCGGARCGGCATSCGRSSSRCFPPTRRIHAVAVRVWMTVSVSTRSCSCWSRGSPGDTCRASWAAHRRPRTAGLRTGRPNGVWERLHRELLRRLNAAGQIDWSTSVVDGSHIRALLGGS